MDLPAKGRINHRCIGSFMDMSSHCIGIKGSFQGPKLWVRLRELEKSREGKGGKESEVRWLWVGGCGLGTLVT